MSANVRRMAVTCDMFVTSYEEILFRYYYLDFNLFTDIDLNNTQAQAQAQ